MWEVDHPATQAYKREQLATAGIAVPDNTTYVPIDFRSQSLPEQLQRHGFDAHLPSFFSWLGVSMYLEPATVLDTLRYEEELKDADQVFSDLGKTKSRADMLKMAEELIRSRAGSFDPGQFKNHYAEALRDLVKQKLASGGSIPVEDEKEPGGGKVIDFMEALKRSLKGGDKATDKPAAPTERPKAKSATPSKTTAKAKPKPAAKKKRA